MRGGFRLEQLTHLEDYEGKQIQGARDYQEDDFGFDAMYKDTFVMALADGMGGYAGGKAASGTVIQTFINVFNPDDQRTTSERLDFSMLSANAALAKIIAEQPELDGMGCTFVGAVISKKFTRLHWISVGDSPFWLYRNGQLSRLNIDHSKRTELLEQLKSGKITQEELAANPERNSLMSALTGETPSMIDNNTKSLEAGDILLLASDGLLSLSEQEIGSVIAQANNSVVDLSNLLLGAVNRKAHPGQDNTTVLAVKIPPPPLLGLGAVGDSLAEPTLSTPSKKNGTTKFLKYLLFTLLLILALAGAFFAGQKYKPESPPVATGDDDVITKPVIPPLQEGDTKKPIIKPENQDKKPEKEKPKENKIN